MKCDADMESRLKHLRDDAEVFHRLIGSCRNREDFHGVSDAANDLRVIQAEIAVLEWVMA